MQSDSQDEQWTLPDSRDGEPVTPDERGTGSAGDESVRPATSRDAGMPLPQSDVPLAPRMPGEPIDVSSAHSTAAPQMPTGATVVPAWGSVLPPALPAFPPPPDSAPASDSGSHEHVGEVADLETTTSGGLVDEPSSDVVAAAAAIFLEPGSASSPGAVAPVVEGDWLANVCPYLASEDGTYRSASPDGGHRCTAQDPPATLPLAFQERFCLTDRHPRCEMYKFAQEASAGGGIPMAHVQATSGRGTSSASVAGGANRQIVVIAAGLGGAAILLILFILALSSCSSDPAAVVDGEASPTPQTSGEPGPTPKATPKPSPRPTDGAGEVPDGTVMPSAEASGQGVAILYEVQDGEKLLKIAETFGVTRKRLIAANEGMADKQPYVSPGDIIIVPVSSDMSIEEIEAIPGYQGPAG